MLISLNKNNKYAYLKLFKVIVNHILILIMIVIMKILMKILPHNKL